MYLTTNVVATITTDRLREAGAARRARADRQPPTLRRSRRVRALATRQAVL